MTNRYAIGFGLSGLLFLASVWADPSLRLVLWGIALVSDFITPILTVNLQTRLPRLSSTKLPERYGLFVIIVLGEAIVGIIGGVAEVEGLTLAVALESLLSLALVFGLWWIYFDYIGHREPKQKLWWLVPWSYLHLPLVMSVAAIGAAILNVLAGSEQGAGAAAHWLLAGAVAAALISIALIETTLHHSADEPVNHSVSIPIKLAVGAIALALALWGSLTTVTFLIVLLLLVLVPIIYGIYVWHQSAEMAGE